MSQVLDYSAGFPGAANIAAAGFSGAVRYVGYPERRKCTTSGELVDFDRERIGLAAVHEGAATDWRGGFSAGQGFGRRARDHANAIGFPADRPIYMAIDQDVVNSGEFATAEAYIRGASTVLGGSARTGVYGEANIIERMRNARADGEPICEYFWLTTAWSQGKRPAANLFQRAGTVVVGGIACDINDVLTADWGQHNYAGGLSMADLTQTQFNQFMDSYLDSKTSTVHGQSMNLKSATFNAAQWAGDAFNTGKAITGQLSTTETKVLAAVASDRPVVDMDADDIEALISGFSAATRQAMRDVLGSLND